VYSIVFQRQPTGVELQVSLDFLHSPISETDSAPVNRTLAAKPDSTNRSSASLPAPSESPLKWLCWALLSSNEFLFVN
jgi:hypothetical protein